MTVSEVLSRVEQGLTTVKDAEFLDTLITQLQQDIFDLTMVIEGELANEQQSISAGVFDGAGTA